MNAITYLFCDLMTGARLGHLPLSKVSFGSKLNGAGQLSAQLPLGDPRIQDTDPIAATHPGRTAIYVDIDGSLVWGGILWTRRYDRAARTLALSGSEMWSYFAHRHQAADYTKPPGGAYWSVNPADPQKIAMQLVHDALQVGNSALAAMTLNVSGASTPSGDWVSPTYPVTQRQTIASMVSMLADMGYPVGFDFGIDVAYASGVPTAAMNFSQPRRGRTVAQNGLVLSAQQAVNFAYPEDATTCANTVYEMATGAGGSAVEAIWVGTGASGYPLLSSVVSHAGLTNGGSTPNAAGMLEAIATGDLALTAYPPVTPTLTAPLFGTPTIGDYITGDDVRVIVPRYTGVGEVPDERFPGGIDFEFRITQWDATVADEGMSTITFTLGIPPSEVPTQPPLISYA